MKALLDTSTLIAAMLPDHVQFVLDTASPKSTPC